MPYLCCPFCSLRVPSASPGGSACPSCSRSLELTTARDALGYRLVEIGDPLPLSPAAAAVAVALSSLGPASDERSSTRAGRPTA
jgi:hypothetical protein